MRQQANVALQAKNVADIQRIKLLLDRPAPLPTDMETTNASSAEMTVVKLCAYLAEPIAIVEELSNDSFGTHVAHHHSSLPLSSSCSRFWTIAPGHTLSGRLYTFLRSIRYTYPLSGEG